MLRKSQQSRGVHLPFCYRTIHAKILEVSLSTLWHLSPPFPLPFLEGERKSRDSLKFRAAVLYYMLNVDLGIATAPHCLGARLMLGIVSTPIVRYIPPRPPRRHTSMHVTLAGQRRVTWSSIFHRLIVFRAPFFRPARAAGSPFLLFFPRREG